MHGSKKWKKKKKKKREPFTYTGAMQLLQVTTSTLTNVIISLIEAEDTLFNQDIRYLLPILSLRASLEQFPTIWFSIFRAKLGWSSSRIWGMWLKHVSSQSLGYSWWASPLWWGNLTGRVRTAALWAIIQNLIVQFPHNLLPPKYIEIWSWGKFV